MSDELKVEKLKIHKYTAEGSLVPRSLIMQEDLDYCDKNKDYYLTSTYYPVIANIVSKHKPETILEVGVRYGYSLSVMLDASRDTIKRVYCIDSSTPYIWHGIPEAYKIAQLNIENLRRTGRWSELEEIVYLDLDTQLQTKLFLPEKVDLIYLDADHTVIGGVNDVKLTLPLLKDTGIMIIDDVNFEPLKKAVREFCLENSLNSKYYSDNSNRGKLVIWRNTERENI
jgi:predicted O-methyltransferase YrrM